jgi:hypothetical protein
VKGDDVRLVDLMFSEERRKDLFLFIRRRIMDRWVHGVLIILMPQKYDQRIHSWTDQVEPRFEIHNREGI